MKEKFNIIFTENPEIDKLIDSFVEKYNDETRNLELLHEHLDEKIEYGRAANLQAIAKQIDELGHKTMDVINKIGLGQNSYWLLSDSVTGSHLDVGRDWYRFTHRAQEIYLYGCTQKGEPIPDGWWYNHNRDMNDLLYNGKTGLIAVWNNQNRHKSLYQCMVETLYNQYIPERIRAQQAKIQTLKTEWECLNIQEL